MMRCVIFSLSLSLSHTHTHTHVKVFKGHLPGDPPPSQPEQPKGNKPIQPQQLRDSYILD